MLVSIMALDKIKLNQEMMEVVNGGSRRVKMNGCTCDCDNFEEVIPQTEEGNLVVSEAKRAVAEGALHPTEAENIAKKVVNAEKKGESVLTAKTEEGLKRMTEIAQAENKGEIEEQAAKKLAARVVVAEVVAESKLTGSQDSVSMGELAEEVMRRKQEETERRGGVEPSGEELKQMCNAVLNEYSNACVGGRCSSSDEIEGLDSGASSYASADHN
jgi:hypothetical protein